MSLKAEDKQKIREDFVKLNELDLTEREKQKAKELLDELNELGPEGLVDWNIRAHTLLVFISMRKPQIFFEAPAAFELSQ